MVSDAAKRSRRDDAIDGPIRRVWPLCFLEELLRFRDGMLKALHLYLGIGGMLRRDSYPYQGMKLLDTEVEEIRKNTISACGGEFGSVSAAGYSDALEAGTVRSLHTGNSILKSNHSMGWAVHALTGQRIDSGVRFAEANVFACGYGSEMCQQPEASEN